MEKVGAAMVKVGVAMEKVGGSNGEGRGQQWRR